MTLNLHYEKEMFMPIADSINWDQPFLLDMFEKNVSTTCDEYKKEIVFGSNRAISKKCGLSEKEFLIQEVNNLSYKLCLYKTVVYILNNNVKQQRDYFLSLLKHVGKN